MNVKRLHYPILLAGLLAVSGCTTNSPVRDESAAAAPTGIDRPSLDPCAPRWRKGDRWRWNDGYELEVVEVEGPATTGDTAECSGARRITRFNRLDAPDQWLERKGLFKERSQSGTTLRTILFRSSSPHQLFPLEKDRNVAFYREYTANDRFRNHRTSWTVEGEEEITIPARLEPLSCWRLMMRTQSVDRTWEGFERWWYCPEVRHYGRMEYRYGDTASGVRVLTEFTPGRK